MAIHTSQNCLTAGIRVAIARRLSLPSLPGGKTETPDEFWSRVEGAGLLRRALAIYDRIAARNEAWKHVPRETKAKFAERIEREGRRAEVEAVRAKLVASHMTQREIHAELVNRFQPVDGLQTRPWETPNPWECGRLLLRRADEEDLLVKEQGEDYDPAGTEQYEAENRLDQARHRRREAIALAEARRRAREFRRIRAPRKHKPPQTKEAAQVG
jgi:hypothetical protein